MKPSLGEYFLPALACVSLIASCCLVSAGKPYWNDEFYSYYFVSDPSFASMLAAFNDKINNTPLLYFAMGWGWDKVFGSAELSLRLFSSFGICAALVLTWSTLRRTYGFWASSLGTLAVFGTSSVILDQNAEARMYGLFMALCAGAYMLYDELCRTREPGSKWLWLNAIVHVGIVHTHLFGGFFSGAILISIFLTDRYVRLFRPQVYLSVIGSWLTILFYIPSFLIQADAGNPRAWLPEPELMDLMDAMNLTASPFFWRPVLLLPLVLMALYILGRTRARTMRIGRSAEPFFAHDFSNFVFAAVILSIPLFIWLFSITVKPIFLNRYMIPTTLGWAVLFAAVLQRLIPAFTGAPASCREQWSIARFINVLTPLYTLGALTILLIYPIRWAHIYPETEVGEEFGDLTEHSSLPIVIPTSHMFMQQLHYTPDPSRYYFILDWEAAVNEYSGTFGPQEFKHMEAWKRNYPYQFQNVVNTDEFLRENNSFLVLDLAHLPRKCDRRSKGLRHFGEILQCPQWVELRLLHNSAYKVTRLDSGSQYPVLLVERRTGSATSGSLGSP